MIEIAFLMEACTDFTQPWRDTLPGSSAEHWGAAWGRCWWVAVVLVVVGGRDVVLLCVVVKMEMAWVCW